MRPIVLLPLLLATACNVDNDSNNDQVTLEYNQQALEDAASDAANAAEDIAAGAANVAESTGQAISNEVGDIDVNVDVTRDKGGTEASNSH